MALVENLVVALGLRASGFSAGLNKTKKELSDWEKKVNSTKVAVAGFLRNVAGLAIAFVGLRSIGANFSNAMNTLGDLQDAATKLGMSASALRKFQFAATQSGVEVEGLNTALQKMLVNVSESASDPKTDIFARLGLSAKKLKGLSPETQFTLIASKLSKVTNAADRAAIAVSIFGKSGPALIPMLSDLEGLVSEADRLKLAFSDLDIAKVEAAGDEWAKVKEEIQASWQALAIEMAPAIGVLSRYMVQLILDARNFGSTFLDMSKVVVGAVGYMTDAVVALSTVMRLQRNVIAAFVSLAGALFPGQSIGALEQAKEYMKNFEKALEDYQKAIKGGFHDDMMKALEDLKREWENLKSKGGPEIEIGGGSEKLMPGAFEKGTREAAVEAAKAGGQDRSVEYAKMSVEKLASIEEKAKKMEDSVLAISSVLGLNAGIA